MFSFYYIFWLIRYDNIEILFSYLQVSNESTSLYAHNAYGRKS
jgi:hypothetical protein